jgi:hypothetical protein
VLLICVLILCLYLTDTDNNLILRLGSVCIHVSALLQLAVSARQDSSTTADDNDVGIPITSLPCYWNQPGKGPVS